MCSLFATKILKFLSYTDRIAKLKYVGYADKLDESLNLEAIYSLVNNVLPLAENGGKALFNQNNLFWSLVSTKLQCKNGLIGDQNNLFWSLVSTKLQCKNGLIGDQNKLFW